MLNPALDRDVFNRANAALKVSMLEGALHAVMVGVAESYLGAFAVELGHSPRRLALLATFPLLVGAACQLISPLLCAWLGSRKRVAVAGALGQTASLAALLAIAATENGSLAALLMAKMCFWVSGGAMAPAWNAWMAHLTLHTERARYFAVRSAFNHVALLVAFGAAGWALQASGMHVLRCFVTLFFIAFTARLASALALLMQADLELVSPIHPRDAAMWPRLGRALVRGKLRVAAYGAALAFGTQLSAPFFTPYMLRELELDYKSFSLLSALSILAKALVFPCCHHVARQVGLRTLLRWAGIGVAIIPVIWALTSRFEALVFAHLLGGAAWAAVEYASFQLMLESAPEGLVTEFFSLTNALTGLAQVSGALCGGLLLGQPGIGYAQVFLISALLRVLPLVLLVLVLRPEHFPRRLRELYTRLWSVRPIGGAEQKPILAGSEIPRALGNRTTDPPPAL
jgi:MFS family permease